MTSANPHGSALKNYVLSLLPCASSPAATAVQATINSPLITTVAA